LNLKGGSWGWEANKRRKGKWDEYDLSLYMCENSTMKPTTTIRKGGGEIRMSNGGVNLIKVYHLHVWTNHTKLYKTIYPKK
jgi:hypothetical protein